MDARPAAALSIPDLTRLFNDAYSDYFVPVSLPDEAFAAMVAMQDVDLGASHVVEADGEPAAFALLAVRGSRSWIAGTGTRPRWRRRGLGRIAMGSALETARSRGLARVELEVLVQNLQAIALYEDLGFRHTRQLEVWERPPSADPVSPPAGVRRWIERVSATTLDRCRDARQAHASAPLPWQRDLPVMERLESSLEILALDSGGDLSAWLIARAAPAAVQILDLSCAPGTDPEQALALGTAILQRHPGLPARVLNLVAGDPASAALGRLGFAIAHRQREMRIDLA